MNFLNLIKKNFSEHEQNIKTLFNNITSKENKESKDEILKIQKNEKPGAVISEIIPPPIILQDNIDQKDAQIFFDNLNQALKNPVNSQLITGQNNPNQNGIKDQEVVEYIRVHQDRQSLINQIDSTYYLQKFHQKILFYELQLYSCEFQNRIKILKSYQESVQQKLNSIIRINKHILVNTLKKANIYQTNSQKMLDAIQKYRNQVKQVIFPALRQQKKITEIMNKRRIIQDKIRILKEFRSNTFVIYQNKDIDIFKMQTVIYDNLKKLKKNENTIIKRIKCLSNLQQKCQTKLKQIETLFEKNMKKCVLDKFEEKMFIQLVFLNYYFEYKFGNKMFEKKMNENFNDLNNKIDKMINTNLLSVSKFQMVVESTTSKIKNIDTLYRYLKGVNLKYIETQIVKKIKKTPKQIQTYVKYLTSILIKEFYSAIQTILNIFDIFINKTLKQNKPQNNTNPEYFKIIGQFLRTLKFIDQNIEKGATLKNKITQITKLFPQ